MKKETLHHKSTKDCRDYYKQLYANKMNSLEEISKFLVRCESPKTELGRNRKYKQTSYKYWNSVID